MSFSSYDSWKPTVSSERKDKRGWINWGKDNLYPEYLISLTNRSALHNAILNLKATMLGKNGFVNQDWQPNTIQFLKNLNNVDDLETILSKIATDLVIFGGYVLNVIWSKDRTKIVDISHVPLESVRIAIPNEDNPNQEQYYVCDDWSNTRQNEPVLYDGFSTVNKKNGSQILYVKEYRAGNNYYPVPEYTAGISLMELNYNVNEYHLNTVLNQFSPSMHINIPRIPNSDEEMEELVERLKGEYEGAKKAGNVIISFSENTQTKNTFEPIMLNDSDSRFTSITKWMLDSIFSAHNVTDQSLFGIEAPGKLNDHSSLIESVSLFQAQYIAPKQALIEKVINTIGKVNNITDVIKIEKYSLNIEPNMSVGDMIAILSATITDKQKVSLFMNSGFTRIKALELVNSGNENNKN